MAVAEKFSEGCAVVQRGQCERTAQIDTLAEVPNKIHDFTFGPAAIVFGLAIPLSKKCTMAAVVGFHKRDISIGKNSPARLRLQADEGVVGGMNDQRRDCDAIHNVGSCGARVIIISA